MPKIKFFRWSLKCKMEPLPSGKLTPVNTVHWGPPGYKTNSDQKPGYAGCVCNLLNKPVLEYSHDSNSRKGIKNKKYVSGSKHSWSSKSIYFILQKRYLRLSASTQLFVSILSSNLVWSQMWTESELLPGWWVVSSRTRGCRRTHRGRSLPPPCPSELPVWVAQARSRTPLPVRCKKQ